MVKIAQFTKLMKTVFPQKKNKKQRIHWIVDQSKCMSMPEVKILRKTSQHSKSEGLKDNWGHFHSVALIMRCVTSEMAMVITLSVMNISENRASDFSRTMANSNSANCCPATEIVCGCSPNRASAF